MTISVDPLSVIAFCCATAAGMGLLTFETAKFYFIFKWGLGHEGGRNVGEIMESEDRIGGERIDTETKPVLGEERIATATRRTPARSHTSRRSPAAPDA